MVEVIPPLHLVIREPLSWFANFLPVTCDSHMSHVTPVTVTCHRPGVTQDCDVSSIRSHISKAMLRSRVCLSLIDYINGVASWINGLWSDSLEEVWNWV